jgi:hypothetical protein
VRTGRDCTPIDCQLDSIRRAVVPVVVALSSKSDCRAIGCQVRVLYTTQSMTMPATAKYRPVECHATDRMLCGNVRDTIVSSATVPSRYRRSARHRRPRLFIYIYAHVSRNDERFQSPTRANEVQSSYNSVRCAHFFENKGGYVCCFHTNVPTANRLSPPTAVDGLCANVRTKSDGERDASNTPCRIHSVSVFSSTFTLSSLSARARI